MSTNLNLQRENMDLRAEIALYKEEIRLQKAQIARLTEQSSVDPLTGLGNRRAFDHAFPRMKTSAVRRNQALSVAVLDCDGFKSINDTYGHLAGDGVLREIGGILKRHLRETDLAARFGGDEFVVLLADTDESQAIKPMGLLCSLIEKSEFVYSNKEISVHVSIGIATLQDGETEVSLLTRADEALYRAKAKGKNQVVLWSSESPVLRAV